MRRLGVALGKLFRFAFQLAGFLLFAVMITAVVATLLAGILGSGDPEPFDSSVFSYCDVNPDPACW